MNSIQPPHAWQLGAVSRMGRVTSFALVALAVDVVLTRGSIESPWIVAALVAIALVVAIRVIRGFPRSLAAATATFLVAGTIGLTLSTRSLVPVAILGVVASLIAAQRERPAPTIELTRTSRDGPEPATVRR
jgi:hypothetical protein